MSGLLLIIINVITESIFIKIIKNLQNTYII